MTGTVARPTAAETWGRPRNDVLVVTRCDDLEPLVTRPSPPDGATCIEPLDLTDPAAVAVWIEITNQAFERQWTAADHEAAFTGHPIIDVQQTWVALHPSGHPIGVGSVGVYRGNRGVGLGHYLAVRPGARHAGVGRQLAEHRYRWLATSGVTAIESQTRLSRVGSLWLHFDLGFAPKYRLDPWNSPRDAGLVDRARAAIGLRRLHRRWVRERARQLPSG